MTYADAAFADFEPVRIRSRRRIAAPLIQVTGLVGCMAVAAHLLLTHQAHRFAPPVTTPKTAVELPHVAVSYTGLMAPLTAAGTVATTFAESAPLAAVFRWAAAEKAAQPEAPVEVATLAPATTSEAAPAIATADTASADADDDDTDTAPLPIPRPDLSPLVETVPVPVPRPAGLNPTAPVRMPRPVLAQRGRAPLATAAAAPVDNRSFFDKIFGTTPSPAGPALAYANPEDGLFRRPQPSAVAPTVAGSAQTAIYDISAHTVYLPDGSTLEAHSGLGNRLDDPRYVHERMRGPTPPHLYELTLRESLFHGVQAIRLTPVGGNGSVYGRNGLLAHTFMLGPNGDSNGCVSFRNYKAFLQAYQSGLVRRLQVVVSRS